ncbi:MAG: hypothetical protein KKA84_16220 [Bacteroidetes bacterium]|nr:hypothetical protein [Bacteroidota bacterium]
MKDLRHDISPVNSLPARIEHMLEYEAGKDIVVCPYCISMTFYTYGELSQCDVCRHTIHDGDVTEEDKIT